MKKSGRQAFLENFQRIWADAKASGMSQQKFARAVGLSQKSVSNVLNAGETNRHIRLDTVDAIAKGLGVETWQLFVPDLPLDLIKSPKMVELMGRYASADPDGRDFIYQVAERESAYKAGHPQKNNH